jgi:hypothetical protein
MAQGGVTCYICGALASGACPRCGNFVCTNHRRNPKGWWRLAHCNRGIEPIYY